MDVTQVATDLAAEQQALDGVVAGRPEADWALPTPSPRWTVAHQIAHLAYFDEAAALAITDPDAFRAAVAELWAAAADDGEAGVDELTLSPLLARGPAGLLADWREARHRLSGAAAGLADHARVPWYGPSMGAKSFLTARLMECWAHGQDVVDALGVDRPGTDRLRHVAQLGFLTRGWSYANRGLAVPEGPVRLELVAPSGEVWRFGPDDADEAVAGPAVEFCLVVTQRRHPDDTTLTSTPLAREWLEIAQAFAGPPTNGPEPGFSPRLRGEWPGPPGPGRGGRASGYRSGAS